MIIYLPVRQSHSHTYEQNPCYFKGGMNYIELITVMIKCDPWKECELVGFQSVDRILLHLKSSEWGLCGEAVHLRGGLLVNHQTRPVELHKHLELLVKGKYSFVCEHGF